MGLILTPKIMLHCGILEEYHDKDFNSYTLSSPEKEQIAKQVLDYRDHLSNARKKGISIFLHGSNGTGKSLMAVSILKEAIRQGYSCQMTNLSGILAAYTAGWKSEDSRELFDRRIKNVDFLLIDDVGKEYHSNSGFAEVAFDNLIRYRVGRRKPFILTTNTAISEMQSIYGSSLMSLIQGKCIPIKMVGEDYRRTVQAKEIWKELRN